MDTPSEPLPGALVAALADRYRIERQIGAGGMATVFLAHDLKHDRSVALKVLKPELAAVIGGARFLSEIKTTANLQHPHILPLHDSGEVDGAVFYVMPFVDGESLRDRLTREKQLPVDDAVRIATEVADALHYAHGHGVIHRDIKPENILLHDGHALVADFGIALAASSTAGTRMTETGMSLGTPQYMSPEQAMGERTLDARTDVYALGCVLYEMLSGDPPFTGSTAQAIVARVLTAEPESLLLTRRTVPVHVEQAVRVALQKLPADRWRSARDFADALRGARRMEGDAPSDRAATRTARLVPRWAGITGVAATGILIGVALMTARRPAASTRPTLRFNFVTTDSERFVPVTPAIPFTISADDRKVAYVGAVAGGRRIYVRGLDDMQTRALPGTEGAPLQPTFSPDGKWIAFVKDGRVAKSPVDGGQILTIFPLDGAMNAGMSWADPDTIIASIGNVLMAIPVNGGAPVRLSKPDTARGETQQWGPRVVNKRYVAYVSIGYSGMSGNRLSVLDRRTGRTMLTDHPCTTIVGSVDDRIVWVTPSGNVMVAAIDGDGKVGPSRLVLEGVLVRPGGAAKAALSASGTFLYHRGISVSRLAVVDERGVATPLAVEPRAFGHPRWSPDGSHIAVTVARSGGTDVWILDVRALTMRKLTPPDGSADQPEWSADGQRVVFRYRQPTGTTTRWMPMDGGGAAAVLIDSMIDPYSARPSPDGKWLVFASYGTTGRSTDLAYVPVSGVQKPKIVATMPGFQYGPTVSPDGKWLLHANTGSGRAELYVRAFPELGAPAQITSSGGAEGLWGRDGRTVFYRLGRDVMVAHLAFNPAPSVVAVSKLFSVTGDFLTDPGYGQWDVAADGRHFLMLQNVDRGEETILIYNWGDELRRGWK